MADIRTKGVVVLSPPFLRYALSAALGALILSGDASLALSQEERQKITVAYRTDAPPFSSQAANGFEGFAVDLCERAFHAMPDADIERIGVTAEERFQLLDDGKADILCGPTSITKDRLAKYTFSMPIFVSGISYATLVPAAGEQIDPSLSVAAVVRDTTALSETREDLFEEYFGDSGSAIFQDLKKLREAKDSDSEQFEHVRVVSSYSEGFASLCESKIQYLIGDVDILSAVAAGSKDTACRPIVVRRTLTRELYGIAFSPKFLASPRGQEYSRRIQAEIFLEFQDGTALAAFKSNFGNHVMSDELRYLFRVMQRDVLAP